MAHTKAMETKQVLAAAFWKCFTDRNKPMTDSERKVDVNAKPFKSYQHAHDSMPTCLVGSIDCLQHTTIDALAVQARFELELYAEPDEESCISGPRDERAVRHYLDRLHASM